MTLIVAHRGFSGKFPENTMLAFRKAIEAGAGGIELDVHLSKDNQLVVMHDGKVERTTNGSGTIDQMAYVDIAALDAGQGEHPPLLEPVIILCKEHDTFLNIEIKARGTEQQVVELVKKHGASDLVLVSSFNHAVLPEIKRLEPSIKTAVLVPNTITSFATRILGKVFNRPQVELINAAAKVSADAINPFHKTCTPAFLKAATAKGYKVYPWTLDDPAIARKLVLEGAAGIITNRPDLMIGAGLATH
jgi:glycerophosphoryl diester phosphodiesterase